MRPIPLFNDPREKLVFHLERLAKEPYLKGELKTKIDNLPSQLGNIPEHRITEFVDQKCSQHADNINSFLEPDLSQRRQQTKELQRIINNTYADVNEWLGNAP